MMFVPHREHSPSQLQGRDTNLILMTTYPASCTMGTGSFPGVKRPGRGVDHPPSSSASVKERVELYLYSPSGPSWPVIGRTLLYIATVAPLAGLHVSL
jgi:hypothetical protein